MNFPTHPRIALLFCAVLPAVLLVACGGRSDSLGVSQDEDAAQSFEDGGPGSCTVLPCPSSTSWNASLCACELVDDAGEPVTVDSSDQCQGVECPLSSFLEVVDNECLCVPYPGEDASPPDASEDAPYIYPVADASEEVTYYEFDAPYYGDSQAADADFCGYYYNYCGPGYYATGANCQCTPCTTQCPLGQTPSSGCGACEPCTTQCPAGFDQTGPNCGCVPHGTDAGTTPPPVEAGVDGGAGCTLEGYTSCANGSWCSLGTCPDGKTQYGCYCNADGTTTCNLACPAPPLCDIPGVGQCASGSTCSFGTCDGDAGSLLYCTCEYGGSGAYCNVIPCSESYYLGDAGPAADAGPSCYLEGYTQCPIGQFCQLGTCPGGTAYGCTCNADGTTDCNLVCPPPPPCTIPGLGTCPYGQACTYGTCSSGATSQLVCYCEQSGSASCYTESCTAFDGGAED